MHKPTSNPHQKRFVPTRHEYIYVKKMLLDILEQHVGAENAIIGDTLAGMLNYSDDRTVRELIRDLIRDGYEIAAGNSKELGYFMANKPEEGAAYLEVLRSRFVEDILRWHDAAKNFERVFKQRYQLRLPLLDVEYVTEEKELA